MSDQLFLINLLSEQFEQGEIDAIEFMVGLEELCYDGDLTELF